MNTADRDQRDAAVAHARHLVRSFDREDVLPGMAHPDPTPQHRAAVQMIVGDKPAVCAHLAAAPGAWTVVFALGWDPGTLRCGVCAVVALGDAGLHVDHCSLCGASEPPWPVVLTAGNVVATLNACEPCHDALTGEEEDHE